MTATKNDIMNWLRQAKDAGAKYLVVGHDPFDNDNFPVFCDSGQECTAALTRLVQNGNRYDEVYDLSLSIDEQLAEYRAMHLPPRTD